MSLLAGGAGVDPTSVHSKPVAICISASSDMSFAAAVTFINFIRIHGVESFHFRFFSDSKLPRMEKIFRDIGADFKVELYRPPVSWTKLWGSRAIAYFSPLVLAKFEGFRLLSSFPTVVWLDYDIVITKPIAELWTRDDFDVAFQGSSQPMRNSFSNPPDDIDGEREGMSAGVISFKRSFLGHEEATRNLYNIFSLYSSTLYYPEQAIFDIFFQAHGGYNHWRLEEKFGAEPGKESTSNAIVHAYGPKKFWNGRQDSSWNNHFFDWLELGGWGWKPLHNKLSRIIRGAKYLTARFLVSSRVLRGAIP